MKDSVLLIQPNYRIKKDETIWAANPPLGLCYLAAAMEKEKIPVKILDAHIKNLSIRECASLIKKNGAKYVGFSILTPAADWCADVAKLLPESMIKIAGGPHPSALPEETLKSGFDIVALGEGEETLVEIVKNHKKNCIKGIAFKKGNSIIRTPLRPPLDPNTFPLPARHLIVKGGTNKPYFSSGTRYYPWSPIFTSRGCPYSCYFCNKNIFGLKFRPRTPENVLTEIDHLVRVYGVKEIDIYDDNFNFDLKRAEKIMDLIIQKNYKIYIRFSNGIRADKITKSLLRKMKKVGTDYVAFGIESGDAKILRQIPKGETLTQIRRAVQMTHEAKIPVSGFFMFGLIGDTQKTMQKTIDFAKSLPFDRAIFNIATPYPGTRMWSIVKQQQGNIFLKKWVDYHHVSGKMHYSLPDMATPEEVEEMYKKAHISFYFRPKYILKQSRSILSLSLIPIIYRGLKRIIYSLRLL